MEVQIVGGETYVIDIMCLDMCTLGAIRRYWYLCLSSSPPAPPLPGPLPLSPAGDLQPVVGDVAVRVHPPLLAAAHHGDQELQLPSPSVDTGCSKAVPVVRWGLGERGLCSIDRPTVETTSL